MGVHKKVDGILIKLFGIVLERVKKFILGFCVVGLRIRPIDRMDVVDLELSMSIVGIWVDCEGVRPISGFVEVEVNRIWLDDGN